MTNQKIYSVPTAPVGMKPRDIIRDAVGRLRVAEGQVLELRALKVPAKYGKPFTVAGWYDALDRLADDAANLEVRKPAGIYVTLNTLNPALLARACNRLIDHPESATADHDITRLVWLPIDIDPVRPAGVSASSAEIEAARIRAIEVAQFLAEEFETAPDLYGFSGNGWHILTRIDLPNSPDSVEIVKRIIDAAADMCSDAAVSIDRTVFNPARIWKLYGTQARKGDPVERLDRVHRRACLVPTLEMKIDGNLELERQIKDDRH